MTYLKLSRIVLPALALMGTTTYADEHDPSAPRVPADQRAVAKALKNPIKATLESVAKGKAIYEGAGACSGCHGLHGDGKGPSAASMNPGPRNFTNPAFQQKRADGELMWVLKNGSPGTGMVQLVDVAISEEEGWHVINYVRSLERK